MKKLLIATSMLALAGCGYASPDAGQEAVLVAKPWFFGSGGVYEEPVKTGSTLVAASTGAVYVDVTPKAFVVKFDDLMPSNGIPLDFQSVVRIQVTDSVSLVRDWGGAEPKDAWFWRNINPQYENLVRNAVKKHDMNALALSGAAVEAVDQEVQTGLAAFLKQTKMPVKLLGVTVGRANPPEEIKAQRIQTAAEQQREQTMAAAKRAEDAREAAELSRAVADNAYRAGMNLSPEQFVDLQRIQMMKDVCAKGGCTFIAGNASPIVGR